MAFGLHRSRDLNLPGHELDGVVKGIDFLLNVNLGYRFEVGKKVVVIAAAGNVAIDVAPLGDARAAEDGHGGLAQ